ncbi:MAG: aldo/keto reductase, partial [bacterium]
MRYRLLGPSGLRVSELCLGTMSFGDAWGFGADEKESHRILDTYAESGGNFLDLADKYHEGQSEQIVGD